MGSLFIKKFKEEVKMVVILNPKTSEDEIERLIKELESLNVTVDKSK